MVAGKTPALPFEKGYFEETHGWSKKAFINTEGVARF